MRPLLWSALLLAACGGASNGSTPTASAAPSDPAIFPGECMLRCENVRPQLIHDFGALYVDCGTKEVLGAMSNDACNCVFERQFGVRLNGRFAEPLPGMTRCPP